MSYDSSAIDVLSGVESVRRRPAMYIDTSEGITPLFFLFGELFGNSVDEARAGHANTIWISANECDDGIEVQVRDNGRGLPTDYHEKAGMPTCTALLTKLHSGGKFGGSGYKNSTTLGLHGVGLVCVNALSKRLHLQVTRGSKTWTQDFARGVPGDLVDRRKKKGESKGTSLTFVIDDELRDNAGEVVGFVLGPNAYENFLKRVKEHLEGVRFLYDSSLTIYLNEEELQCGGGVLGAWEAKNGQPVDSPAEAFTLTGDLGDVALVWGSYKGKVGDLSWVNTLPTPQHGSHVDALRSSVMGAFSALYKGKGDAFNIWDLSHMAFSAYVKDPEFQGQTKYKLTGCSKYKRQVKPWATEALVRYFEKGEGNRVFKWLAAHVDTIYAEKLRRENDAKKRSQGRVKRDTKLPAKLAVAPRCKPEERELLLVEGDSASGGLRLARDSYYQEILPLRGKIPNAARLSEKRMLANQEVKDIAAAIGGGIGPDFDLSQVRIGKLCLLCDADVDGAHIESLIISLLITYFRPLVEAGWVYVVNSPLFVGTKSNGKRVFGHTLDDVRGCKTIARLKGHAEADMDELEEYALNPSTRRLRRLTWSEGSPTHLQQVMGPDSSYRRELLGLEAHNSES